MRANGGYEIFDFEIRETNITEEQGIAKERYYFDIYQPLWIQLFPIGVHMNLNYTTEPKRDYRL